MAQLILIPIAAVIASSATASIGSAVAAAAISTGITTAFAALGGVIDSMYVYPAIFKQKGPESPVLESVRVSSGSEGSPIPFSVGKIRVSGQIIWVSDFYEQKKKKKVSSGGKTQTTTTYQVDIAIAFGHGSRTIKKIYANSEVIYDEGKYEDSYESIELYDGDMNQLPDPTIEEVEGSGNVPPFRGICYAVIRRLNITESGNGIPQFNAIIDDESNTNVSATIQAFLRYGGRASSMFDLTGVPVELIQGYSVPGVTDLVKTLEPVFLRYDLVAREFDGLIKLNKKDQTDIVSVQPEELGFSENQPSPRFSLTEKSNRLDPSEVNIKFADASAEYGIGQKCEKNPSARVEHVVNIDIPMAMFPTEARKLAQTKLFSSLVEGSKFKTTLPIKYAPLQEADVLMIPLTSQMTERVRLTSIAKGANGVVEVEGFVEEVNTQSGLIIEYPGGDPLTTRGHPPAPQLFIFDISPLTTNEIHKTGVYVGIKPAASSLGVSGQRSWVPFSVLWDESGGSTFDLSKSIVIEEPLVAGVSENALGTPLGMITNPSPSPITSKDTVNTLTVDISTPKPVSGYQLSSATTDQVKNGQNWCILGNEIFAFETATSLGAGRYTLSNLYRGLLDTFLHCGTHSSGETFALLEDLEFIEIPSAKIGSLISYRAVPSGGSISAYPTHASRQLAGNTIRPYRPIKPFVTRVGYLSQTIIIWWKRQSRVPRPALDFSSGSVDDSPESYEVEIRSLSGSLKRKKTVIPANFATVSPPTDQNCSVIYSVAEQTTDGHPLGDPIKVRIWMKSALLNGRYVDLTE